MPDMRLSDDLQKQERENRIKDGLCSGDTEKTSPPGILHGGLMSPLALPAIDFFYSGLIVPAIAVAVILRCNMPADRPGEALNPPSHLAQQGTDPIALTAVSMKQMIECNHDTLRPKLLQPLKRSGGITHSQLHRQISG
jgi:hypothetical protein